MNGIIATEMDAVSIGEDNDLYLSAKKFGKSFQIKNPQLVVQDYTVDSG